MKPWSHSSSHLSQVNADLRIYGRDIMEGTYRPQVDGEMQVWSRVSDEWPDEPADNHLHIFVIPGTIDSAGL